MAIFKTCPIQIRHLQQLVSNSGDLNDTAYTLTPEAGGTRLHLRVSYRLTTDFNTYANWWAQALLDNFAQTVLQLYKTRLEGSA